MNVWTGYRLGLKLIQTHDLPDGSPQLSRDQGECPPLIGAEHKYEFLQTKDTTSSRAIYGGICCEDYKKTDRVITVSHCASTKMCTTFLPMQCNCYLGINSLCYGENAKVPAPFVPLFGVDWIRINANTAPTFYTFMSSFRLPQNEAIPNAVAIFLAIELGRHGNSRRAPIRRAAHISNTK